MTIKREDPVYERICDNPEAMAFIHKACFWVALKKRLKNDVLLWSLRGVVPSVAIIIAAYIIASGNRYSNAHSEVVCDKWTGRLYYSLPEKNGTLDTK